MSGCTTCGREEGHHLNCEALMASQGSRSLQDVPEGDLVETGCAVGGCTNQRWSNDKRVKYCEDHKDAKSRKE